MSDKGLEQFLKIKQGVEQAQEDTTPFALVTDNEVVVTGDANKTEVKKNTYLIEFKLREDMVKAFPYEVKSAKQKGSFWLVQVEFKDRAITPRNEIRLLSAGKKLLPFFNKLTENGDVTELDDKEAGELFVHYYDQFDLAIYNLVAVFLGIDDYHGEYMMATSVFEVMMQLILNHPEFINEVDGFFG
ncbi:hypothetical protein NRIC_03940 [Enterococcus florum]|uniref:Uncharacterized protein n=1 Tax=Enterococcus florum TaxID=2480627 RepID=A0A4P5PG83_9ENTE|nr:hypothetical protein [Enterococcus florum]GCF92503.1 hypothetical protein NRIC_03940 [Enterococcus florum]